MQRWVLHIDMDAFFASVEQLTRPTLRGRPVVVGGVDGRGVVAGASYEARAFGVRSATPMHQAKALIGLSAVVVRPRMVVYKAASKRVFELVARHAGVIEQLSVDEAFMEPTALIGATENEVREWGEGLRRLIREETGLTSSIGAGSGKQYAKIASGQAKPDGVFVVPRAREHELLDPLPVRKLWGIGPVAETKLQRIGVATIGDFAKLSGVEVDMTLGSTVGRALWQLAKGHDDRPVEPRAIAKQISAEHTYSRPSPPSRISTPRSTVPLAVPTDACLPTAVARVPSPLNSRWRTFASNPAHNHCSTPPTTKQPCGPWLTNSRATLTKPDQCGLSAWDSATSKPPAKTCCFPNLTNRSAHLRWILTTKPECAHTTTMRSWK